jgi:ABC-type bacteriocin/lantibiotic exporter with double-glycine peptidase domain
MAQSRTAYIIKKIAVLLKSSTEHLFRNAIEPISYLWRLRGVTRRYWKHLIGIGLLGVLITGKSWLSPQITRRIIDVAYPARDFKLFYMLSATLVAANIVSSICQMIVNYLTTYTENLISFRVRMRVFHALHLIPISFVESQQSGMFLERVEKDAAMTAGVLSGYIPQLISLVLTLTVTLVMMFNISPLVTLLVLAGVPPYYVISAILAQRLREWNYRSRRKDEELTTRAVETIQGIPTARLFGVGRWLKRIYVGLLRDRIKISFGMWRARLTWGSMGWVVSYGWGVFLTIGGWYLVFQNRLTLGDAVALGMYIPVLLKPAEDALDFYKSLISASVPAHRITEVIERAGNEEGKGKREDATIAKHLQLKNVSFTYGRSDWRLDDVSIDTPCGTASVIIGPTGSGKTTLLRLLAGLYGAYDGQILVDGIPLSEIKTSSYQKNVAMVMPDNFFFSGTIMENMRIADYPHVREDEVKRIAEILGFNEWLESLPEKYFTRIGVGGMKLSSGQIQRIAVLRALLKKPKILLLDEITSAMDVESESRIMDGLQKLVPEGCITFMTTHRLNLTLLSWIDRIIVLQNGRIMEQGAPHDLLAGGGEYKRLMDVSGFGRFLAHGR